MTTSVTIALVTGAAVATVVVSWILTWCLIRLAPCLGLEDVPNHRSSHARTTARGGGLALVLAVILAAIACALALSFNGAGVIAPPACTIAPTALQFTAGLAGLATQPLQSAWALALAACFVLAALGLADDLRSLSYVLRLIGQTAAVTIILLAAASSTDCGGSAGITLCTPAAECAARALAWPANLVQPMTLIWLLLLLLLGVWWINLFNFMDGIDGLAANEALFLLGCYLLLRWTDADSEFIVSTIDLYAILLAAALLGFIPHNWPPARIFMGDTGSLFLGVSIFLLVMYSVTSGHIGVWFWPIAAGMFASDATATLMRRYISGNDVTSAHRSHLYQHLSQRWASHRRVTLVYSAINFLWFLPLALVSQQHPDWGIALLIGAYLPALAICWCAGAGRSEPESGQWL